MYILLVIVLMSGAGVNMQHIYFESLEACTQAAFDVESMEPVIAFYRVKAICIKGD